MSRPAESPAASPPAPWRRRLVLLGLVLAGVGLFLWLAWPRIQFRMRIGELHSDDPAVRRQAAQDLTRTELAGIEEDLFDVLADPSASFPVRTQVGEILVARSRIGLVEEALRSEVLEERLAALVTLHDRQRRHGSDWFRKEYVDRPEYRVAETVEAWLGREGDLTRHHAIELAVDLDRKDLVGKIRPLARVPRRGALGAAEQRLVVSAAGALVRFGECAAVPDLLVAARSGDARVRYGLMDLVYLAVVGPQAKCPDAVPAAEVEALVMEGLGDLPEASRDDATLVRQKALYLLREKPEWTAKVASDVQKVLDDPANTIPVRREALGALSRTGSEEFADRLPRYFHSSDPYLRSEAVTASRVYSEKKDPPLRYEACWIGMLRDEARNSFALGNALGGLRATAGQWVGLTPKQVRAIGPGAAFDAFLKELFEKGESQGIVRAAWAEQWFRWWAERQGLDEAGIEDSVAVRAAFWKAAEAGDPAGAKAALAAAKHPLRGLFTYEEGWLAARGG